LYYWTIACSHPGCDCTSDWKGSHCEIRARPASTTPIVPEPIPNPNPPSDTEKIPASPPSVPETIPNPSPPSEPKKDPIASLTETESKDSKSKKLGIILGILLVGIPLLVCFALFVYQCERRFVVNEPRSTAEDKASLFRPLGSRRNESKHVSSRDLMTSFHIKAMMKRNDNSDEDALMNRNISPPTREEEQITDEEAGFLT
jgi:hypothetical protein